MAYAREREAGWALHPGEILKEEFLRPLELSAYALAKAITVPNQTISEITLGKRGISADVAIRLAKYFGTSEQFWMNLQAAYELAMARKASRRAVTKIRPHKDRVA